MLPSQADDPATKIVDLMLVETDCSESVQYGKVIWQFSHRLAAARAALPRHTCTVTQSSDCDTYYQLLATVQYVPGLLRLAEQDYAMYLRRFLNDFSTAYGNARPPRLPRVQELLAQGGH